MSDTRVSGGFGFIKLVLAALAQHPSDSDEQIADRVLAKATTREALHEMLWPLAVAEVQHRRRGACRIVERSVVVKQAVPLTGTPARIQALLQEGFAIPGEGWVTWGEATHEQHLARADWLHQHAVGTLASEARHRWAAEFLSQRNFGCLNDAPADLLHQALPRELAKSTEPSAVSDGAAPISSSESTAATAPPMFTAKSIRVAAAPSISEAKSKTRPAASPPNAPAQSTAGSEAAP